MLYLYPLLLQALKGVSFQPWLRGSIDGITATQARALMSLRDRFRRGLFTNVFLHARLEQRDVGGGAAVRREVKRTGAERQLIHANARKMRKLVARLDWSPASRGWVAYGDDNSYDEEDARRKDAFVREVAASRPWRLAWDLGCNNGRHARIAAEGARHVVALDADEGSIELLYRELKDAGDETILPLTMNVADPSPALGWRGSERKGMLERGRPDLVLSLALVHHLAIGANIPLREVVEWLAELGAALVVEFPTREDPMVQKLLARKRAGLHPDYDRDVFEHRLDESFEVRRSEQLASGTRILYFATPRISTD
jgi:SAM-dependent methyltransferase